jgi:hypothetical protein
MITQIILHVTSEFLLGSKVIIPDDVLQSIVNPLIECLFMYGTVLVMNCDSFDNDNYGDRTTAIHT